jgi:hypothetical protein
LYINIDVDPHKIGENHKNSQSVDIYSKTFIMARAISLKTIVALLFAFVFQIAFAAPTECNSISDPTSACNIDLDVRDLFKRYSGSPRGKVGTGGPAKSDYPSDEEIRKAYLKPAGPHVFYSGIGADTTDPYAFSQKVGGVILRNAFPKKYLNQNKRSEEWLGDFWDRTSGKHYLRKNKKGECSDGNRNLRRARAN